MRRADETVEPHAFCLAGAGGIENRRDGRRRQHMVADHAEVAEAERFGFADHHRGGRGGGLEADGEKDHLAMRMGAGEAECVGGRIDHPDVGAARPRLVHRQPRRGRHAQAVAVAADDHLGALEGQRNGHVDAPDRQHAHRAAGAVDHAHLCRQQVGDTVARDRVGVAAAELHEGVIARRLDLGADGGGEPLCQRAVAELVDVFHSAAPTPGP